MNISVVSGKPSYTEVVRIETLLADAAFHLNDQIRTPFVGAIEVHVGSKHPKAPITLARNNLSEPITVWLSANETYWGQYVYQFAHEFCHVLTDHYEQLLGNPNAWLHETVCEIASIFVLKRMARQWGDSPRSLIEQNFAKYFGIYASERVQRPETKLPSGLNFSEWLKAREEELRISDVTNEHQRLNQSLIAYILLPLFEDRPEGWNAITKFPTTDGYLEQYLADWHTSVEPEDREIICTLSDMLGYVVGN